MPLPRIWRVLYERCVIMRFRSRFSAFALALAVVIMVTAGVLAYDDYLYDTVDGYGVMPLANVSGYAVSAFTAVEDNAPLYFDNISPGYAYLGQAGQTVTGGFVVTIPANSVPGDLYCFGLYPLISNERSGTSFTSTNSLSGINITGATYLLTTSRNGPLAGFTELYSGAGFFGTRFGFSDYVAGGAIHIPAHSQTLYLYVFGLYYGNTNQRMGVYYAAGGSISFVPDSSASTGSALDQILAQLRSLNTTSTAQLQDQQNAPARKAEDSFIGKFGSQIDKVEDALSPSNPALPNGGDVGGFMSDVSEGLGLSGSSFSASDLNDAASGFSGADAVGVGGPWEFFTQGVADSLSGDAPMGIDADYDPILAWFEASERRYGTWSNP